MLCFAVELDSSFLSLKTAVNKQVKVKSSRFFTKDQALELAMTNVSICFVYLPTRNIFFSAVVVGEFRGVIL